MTQTTGSELDTAKPKRMTMGMVVEALLNRGGGASSSVTLTRNAKGETQIEVVVRTDDTGDIHTIGEAQTAAETVYDALRVKYPLAGGAGAEGA